MIYLYFSETVDWCSPDEPERQQLGDPNLMIFRITPNCIEVWDRCWPRGFNRWQPVAHIGGYHRFIYRGLWGEETRCCTIFDLKRAQSEEPEYDTFRITSKPDFEYTYIIEQWSRGEREWFPVERRKVPV